MNLRWTRTLLVLCLVATTSAFPPHGQFLYQSLLPADLRTSKHRSSLPHRYGGDPSFSREAAVDLNGNGTFEASEQDAYLSRKVGELTEGLVVRLNGTRCPLARISQQLEFLPGGLNLPTLKISLKYQLPLKAIQSKDVNILEYEDTNFPGHAGWKEIVVQGNGIEESSVSGVDKSQQLTHYPEDPAIRPPDDLVARVRFKRIQGQGDSASAPQPASSEAHHRSSDRSYPAVGGLDSGVRWWRFSRMALVFGTKACVIQGETTMFPFAVTPL